MKPKMPKPGMASRARRSGNGQSTGTGVIAHHFPSNKPAFKSGFRGKVRLCLHDEAPRLGAGWRIFYVMVGHKWVRVYDPSSGSKKRVSHLLFDRIAAGTADRLSPMGQSS
jgi:hypothetical protein